MNGAGILRETKSRPKPEKKKWSGPALWRAILKNKGRLPEAGAFFLVSLAQCLSVPSPYAVCCLAAVLWAGLPVQGALAGLCAGLLFRAAWGLPVDAALFAACGALFALNRIPWNENRKLYFMTLSALLLRALPGAFFAQTAQDVLLSAVGLLLGMAMTPALKKCAGMIKKQKKEWTEDDLLCLLLPGLLLIAGAARLKGFGVNIGCAVSAGCVLMLSWACGSAAGMLAGMGCGLALLLSGQSALPLVTLTFGALTAGLFQRKNRLLPLGMFLLSSVVMTYLIAFSFQAPAFFGSLWGGAAFVFLPRKRARAWAAVLRGLRWSQPRENAYIRLKMQRWVRSIDRLADALPHPRMEKSASAEKGESLREALCEGCDRLPVCWRDRYDETKAGVEALTAGETDMEETIALINRYFSFCPRISRLPPILRHMDEEERHRANRALCAEYERDMLQTHLTALSQAAQRISLEGLQGDGEEADWIAQADEALEALRFPGKTAFVKKIDGRLTACLTCEPLSLRFVSDAALALQVGTYLGADMTVTERKSGRILLEEKTPLRVISGVATACAVTLEGKRAPGEKPDNGDAVLIEPLTGGRMVLALSDGMGHGAGARDESRKTLEMLSLCLEAGYSRAQAMTAVNGVMLSAAGGEQFATVDLCLIDLWTGEAALNKLGACASVLVQGQKMQWIQGEALPLGIIERVVPMEHRVKLGEGDLMILMSDGITDAFDSEEEIMDAVRRRIGETPQRLADALLLEAENRHDGLPPDDMTVLCARIAGEKDES